MRRTGFLVCAGLVLAACASSPPKPPTPEQMLMGAWTCESSAGVAKIKGVTTYRPGGAATFHLDVAGQGGGMVIEASGDGDATWKLLENDTKLEQTLGGVTVTAAKLNGNVIDPALAQSMIGPYIAGQTAISALEITPVTMKLSSTDGTVTTCSK